MESFLLRKYFLNLRLLKKLPVLHILFVVLSPFEDQNSLVVEEGELQQSDVHKEEGEVNYGPQEQSGTIILEIPCTYAILQELHNSPTGVTSSPSYA